MDSLPSPRLAYELRAVAARPPRTITIVLEHDIAAKRFATMTAFAGEDIEVWQGSRFVGLVKGRPPTEATR